MALTAEEKLQLAEVYAAGLITRSVMNRILSGKITRVENQMLRGMLRMAGRGLARVPGTAVGLAARGAGAARFLVLRHPAIAGAAGIALAYHERERIADLLSQGYDIVQEGGAFGPPPTIERIRPGPIMATIPTKTLKRAVSKANRAVRQGMKILKAGTKAQTGSKPGTLAKGAFKLATKAAGLANPKTKSRIGKAKTKLNKLARRLKKWW